MTPNKKKFWDATLLAIQTNFFIKLLNGFIRYGVVKNHIWKIKRRPLKNSFSNGVPSAKHV